MSKHDPFDLTDDDVGDLFDFLAVEEDLFPLDGDIPIEIVCECGSEKVYGTNTNLHSSWCKKATKE